MEESLIHTALEQAKTKEGRAAYTPPAIVYEGKVTVRAGSPTQNGPFDGPPSPFRPPGS